MNDKQLTQAIAQGIAAGIKAANPGYDYATKQALTPGTNWMHGPGGLFGMAGLDNQVISARITPRGISGLLKAVPTVFTNPLYPYITGIEENEGTEPSTPCEDCLAGVTEACWQTAQFGYICRQTETLTPSRAIERVNRGEVDMQLVNDILGGGDQNDLFNAVRNYNKNTILNVAYAWAMLEVGVLLQNKLVPMVWQGNPANFVGTGYMEFAGLDMLISVGKIDAQTGTTCPALDSDVKEFNYANVNSVDGAGNFRIVRLLSYLEAYLYHNASRQNLLPATWLVSMRPELWYELTEIWPVAYLTTRNIAMPAGNTTFLDATRINEMRDQMRSGMFMFLNGRRHQVVLDDGIVEYDSANDANLAKGEFASNIYMVPLSYLGARPGTYFEHKDYRGVRPELATWREDEIWSDDGRFLWTKDRIKYCEILSAIVEPRVVLKVPQLAGRLNHVKYVPAQHFRSFDQDSDYFFKGGVDKRDKPNYYSDWNPRQ